MATEDDAIDYSPDIEEYVPAIGSRGERDGERGERYDPLNTTYADLEVISSRLETLLVVISNLEARIENILQKHSLVISPTADQDKVLREAQDIEWPYDGPAKGHVSYKYYKYLALRESASASYIRKRYEAALRELTGSNALDLLKILSLIRNEAFLAQDFIGIYIGSMDDTSEFRAAELVQDWAGEALRWVQEIEEMFEGKGEVNSLPERDIKQITEEEARKAQAVFKVKMNSANDEVDQHIELFRRDWSEYAEVFYNKYLGQALQFRLDISRAVYPANSVLGKEVYRAAGSLDTNLSVALTDQARRNRIFDTKIAEVLSLVKMRDTYRNYIHQLSVPGVAIKSGGPGTTVEASDTEEENDFFTSSVRNTAPAVDRQNRYLSSHYELDDRDSDDAHAQYLLRSGGLITGHIGVKDYVTVDGVDINEHSHTGVDGSQQISSASIAPGSLVSSLIDSDDVPPTPQNLKVKSQTIRVVPSGLSIVDVMLSWEIETDDLTGDITYQISFAPID